jgi:hypothetical protein
MGALCNEAGAQLPSNPAAPVTGMKPDRITADPATRQAMQQKEAALRQKRADCGRQAKARKLYFALLKRL